MHAYEAHILHEQKRREMLVNSNAVLPIGTLVLLRLNPQDRLKYPAKFAHNYMGPWVIVERFENGKTYRVCY